MCIRDRDTHETWYLETQEGKNLPVPHCIRGTEGWQIRKELDALRKTDPIDKETFGSTDLAADLLALHEDEEICLLYTSISDLRITSDHRIKLLLSGTLYQLCTIFVQCVISCFRIVAGHTLIAADAGQCLQKTIFGNTAFPEQILHGRTRIVQ